MSSQQSQPSLWLEKELTGYVINTEFSAKNTKELASLTGALQSRFGNAVFCTPECSLHITLLDWIAPLVDYGQDKDQLFKKIWPQYDQVMTEILSTVGTIDVHFNELALSPSTIYVVGHDNGQFKTIRDQFMRRVDLLPGTKLPPNIIHSSLARFTKPLGLANVRSFLATQRIDFTQTITDFRLLRTIKEPTLEFEVVKRYKLRP